MQSTDDHRSAAPRCTSDAIGDRARREYASRVSTLRDIARRVASSRRQLQRAYAEIGNTTFREHLTAVRMDRAAELLARTSAPVREVAHRVGYRQPAQFAKAFRRRHGARAVRVSPALAPPAARHGVHRAHPHRMRPAWSPIHPSSQRPPGRP